MAITRRSFTKGVMDKDTDERLLPGVYRHAENVLVTNSKDQMLVRYKISIQIKKINKY
jgi:hypothetical protein